MSLSVYLAGNTFRLLKGMFFIIANIGEIFGKVWEFAVNHETINQIQLILLVTGFLFTVLAGYLSSKRLSPDSKEMQQSMLAVGITAVVYLIIG